jgi:hypothetical protein
MAHVVRDYNHEREVIVERDTSGYVPTGVLSQYEDDGLEGLVAYYLKNRTPAECNYDMYD